MSPLVSLAPAYFVLFGVLAMAGGAVGFVKAKSRASLVAGLVSGLALLGAAWLLRTPNLLGGYVLGGSVSLALLGRFGPAFARTKKVMPAGMMVVLALGGVLVAAAGLAS